MKMWFFILLRGESQLLGFCVGSEKLFINNEKFILNYLKRYTAPVRKDHPTPGAKIFSLVISKNKQEPFLLTSEIDTIIAIVGRIVLFRSGNKNYGLKHILAKLLFRH